MIKQMSENTKYGYFGIEKQCVEFARRWLCQHRGVLFGDVLIAADIWDKISYYTNILTGEQCPIFNIANGSESLPVAGDLLVYGEQYMSTGHVSVVVFSDYASKQICVYEQNFANQYQQPCQQRRIDFIKYKNRYWLQEKYLFGWKSLQDFNHIL